MPDQSGVEAALAGLIAASLYPAGPGDVSAVEAVCRVFPGWPVASSVEADVVRGIVQVGVVAQPETLRDTTRFLPNAEVVLAEPSSVAVQVLGDQVLLDGLAMPGQLVGLRVDGRAYVVRVQRGQDLNDVAVALAGLIEVDRPCLRAGSGLSMPGGRGLVARSVADTAVGTELRRQTMGFRVMVWAPSAAVRDSVCSVVDAGLATLAFVDVDGWACRVRVAAGTVQDRGSAAGIWRRDLGVLVEFPTVLQSTVPAMLFGIDVVGAHATIV